MPVWLPALLGRMGWRGPTDDSDHIEPLPPDGTDQNHGGNGSSSMGQAIHLQSAPAHAAPEAGPTHAERTQHSVQGQGKKCERVVRADDVGMPKVRPVATLCGPGCDGNVSRGTCSAPVQMAPWLPSSCWRRRRVPASAGDVGSRGPGRRCRRSASSMARPYNFVGGAHRGRTRGPQAMVDEGPRDQRITKDVRRGDRDRR